MKVIFEDEYGTDLYQCSIDYPVSAGDNVILNQEEYKVASKTFYPEQDALVIIVSQNVRKATAVRESTDSARLNNMQNAILALTKRQDASDKKTRQLGEQIGIVRKHINHSIQQEKKEIQ